MGFGPGVLPSLSCLSPSPHPSFRMRQVNIVGTSPPSQPSRKIQTLQAPPDMAPANVTLRTASETSLWLRWMVRFLKGSGGGTSHHPHHLQRCHCLQGATSKGHPPERLQLPPLIYTATWKGT